MLHRMHMRLSLTCTMRAGQMPAPYTCLIISASVVHFLKLFPCEASVAVCVSFPDDAVYLSLPITICQAHSSSIGTSFSPVSHWLAVCRRCVL